MSTPRPDPLDSDDPVDLDTAARAFALHLDELRAWVRDGLLPEEDDGMFALDRIAIAILSRPAARLRGE